MKRCLVLAIAGVGLLSACSVGTKAQGHPQDQMEADLGHLASDELEGRETGTEGEKKSAEYIAKRFEEIGLQAKGDDGYFHSFDFMPHPPVQVHGKGDTSSLGMALVQPLIGTNVVGYLDNKASETIVIGAHHDHLGWGATGSLHSGEKAIHNGADDNGSGIAALLALAERISKRDSDYNYLFIAFSGEEGGLWGSKAYVKNPTIELTSINCMINMDMVGRLNEEKTLVINGVGTSPAWKKAYKKLKVDGIKIATTESGIGPSDQTSFYLADIPAIHFFTGQHGDYHKPSDDTDKINFEGMRSVVAYIDAMVKKVDGMSKMKFTKTKDEEQKQRSFKVTLGIMPDYTYTDAGMRMDGVTEDRPAHKAGMIKGDIVIKIGEFKVDSMEDYMDCLGKFSPGDKTDVVVIRGEEEMTFKVLWD
jgi:hypothetical protein